MSAAVKMSQLSITSRKKVVKKAMYHCNQLLGSHLIACCLQQISVVYLTERTVLINSRNNQL